MKKLFAFLFAVFALAVITVSCSKIVKDKVTGLVDEINDSVLVARIDGSKVNFDIRDASFTNGAVMYGDSVIIHYVGDLSKKRALAEAVYLIARTGVIVEIKENEIDSTAELQTRPASPDQVKSIDKLIEAAKKQEKN